MKSINSNSFFESQLDAIIQAFPDLYYLLDSDGTIVDFNAGRGAKLYMLPEELIGKKLIDTLPIEASRHMHDLICSVIKSESTARMEHSVIIDGEEQFFEARLMPLPNKQVVVIIRNITELKRVKELTKLNEELQKEISERRAVEEQLEQRTHLLSTLLDISNIVSSTMDLKPLLEAILDRLKTIIDYSGAKFLIIQGDKLQVVAHRSALTEKEKLAFKFHVEQMPINKEFIINNMPVVIPDIWSDTPMAKAFRETAAEYLKPFLTSIRSWIGIPIMIKNNVIGALTINHSEPGYYQPHHVEMGMAFANQAAIEFENARLYNEISRRVDELKTMFSVQQAITSRLDRNIVLQLIADEARRLTHSERTVVFLVEGNDLVLSVFSGKDSKTFLGYRLPIGNSIVGKSLLSGTPAMINNAQGNPEAYSDLVLKAGVKSFLSVPLKAASRLIGTITVVDKVTGGFNAEDERILTMLASIAVIGLENSRLYGEEHRRHLEDEQRRHVAEGLRDILAILNSNHPLKDILEFIIEQAARLMGTDAGALYSFQQDKGILTVEAARGLSDDYISNMTIPVGKGVVGRAVVKRRPIAVSDLNNKVPEEFSSDPERKVYLEWLVDKFRGLLAIPLVCKDEIYGGIVLYYPQAKKFSKAEIDLAMTFADQAALAIDNARLRAQAEEMAVASERSRLARDLHDAVTQTLFSTSLIAEVLPKIWGKNPDEGRKRLQELRQLTRGALAEMRTLLLELRPATLVESGLKELLNQLTLAFTGRYRIPAEVIIEGQLVLSSDVKIAFYRIVQEALNNIAKHSGANQVVIKVEAVNGISDKIEVVKLSVGDNGHGFERELVLPESLGLGIMKERAQAVGADLKIKSSIGKGTEITVIWKASVGGNEND